MCNLDNPQYFRNTHEIENFDADTLFELIYKEDIAYLTPVDDDDDTLIEYRTFADMFYEVDKP